LQDLELDIDSLVRNAIQSLEHRWESGLQISTTNLIRPTIRTVETPPAATSLCSTVMAIPMIFGVLVLHPKVIGESILSAFSIPSVTQTFRTYAAKYPVSLDLLSVVPVLYR
jgi:hypothetical protein